MPRPEIRVAVLADNGLVGDALAASLAARPEFVSSGLISPTQPDLVLRLLAGRPEVVIIDADAPGVQLPRLIKKVFSAVPMTNVVIVGDQPDVGTAVAAVRAGAAAWSDRATSVDRLVDVMLGVHHGEAWFPPPLLRAMLRVLALFLSDGGEPQPDDGAPHSPARDAEILECLADGMTADDVGRDFGLSADHVRHCARRAMCTVGLRAASSLSSVGGPRRTAGAGGPSPTD